MYKGESHTVFIRNRQKHCPYQKNKAYYPKATGEHGRDKLLLSARGGAWQSKLQSEYAGAHSGRFKHSSAIAAPAVC